MAKLAGRVGGLGFSDEGKLLLTTESMSSSDSVSNGIRTNKDGRVYLDSIGIPAFTYDASGNVTGLMGPSSVLTARLNEVYIPDQAAMSVPVVLDLGSQTLASYTDRTTDGTGSVTGQVASYAYLGTSGVKLISPDGTFCRIGDDPGATVQVGDGAIGVFIKWAGDQGVGITLSLSNDAAFVNYAQATVSGTVAVPEGWILLTIAQSEFSLNGSFAWATGIQRWRLNALTSVTYPEIGFGGLVANIKTIPIISLSFDDGFSLQYTVAAPILKKYGYSATAYIVASLVGTTNYMTAAQMQDLQTTYGWDLANHGYAHLDYTTLTQAQMIADYTNNYNYLVSIGARAPAHFAYPLGTSATGVGGALPPVVLAAQGALTGRTAFQTPVRGFQMYGQSPTPGLVNAMQFKGQQYGGATATLAVLKSAVDNAITRNECLNIYTHKVLNQNNPAGIGGTPPADGNEVYKDDYEELISYIKRKEMAGSCRVVGNITNLYKIANGSSRYLV